MTVLRFRSAAFAIAVKHGEGWAPAYISGMACMGWAYHREHREGPPRTGLTRAARDYEAAHSWTVTHMGAGLAFAHDLTLRNARGMTRALACHVPHLPVTRETNWNTAITTEWRAWLAALRSGILRPIPQGNIFQ